MKAQGANDFRTKLDPRTIETAWADHLLDCKRCQFVNLDQPVTLANCCPEGAQYLKVILEKANPIKRQ